MPLTVSELFQYDLTRELDTQKYYEIILEKCYNEIKEVHYNQKGTQLFYFIPNAIMESDEYNFYACVRFVIESLREAGYFVRFIAKNNHIYIAWKNTKKQKRIQDDIKFVIKEDTIARRELGLLKKKENKPQLLLTNGANVRSNPSDCNYGVKPTRVIKRKY